MTLQLGTVRPGSTIFIPFDTFAGSTGASVTMTGLAVGDIQIYKNGGTTQRASTTGFTLLDTDGIDFDTLTGIHGFSIDLSSNADAGFYTAGADYIVVVSAITVDSQTVSFVAARFTIGYPDAIINTTIATLASQTSFTLTVGPAEDNALNGCAVCIHDIASAVQLGFGLISAYTGATKTVTLAAGTTFTVAAGDNISVLAPRLLPTVGGRTLDVSTGGEAGVDWANVGSPTTTVGLSGTTVKTATDVETDTQDIQSRMPAALVSGRMDASVGAVAAGVDLSATMKTSVKTQVTDALNVDTYAEIGAVPAATSSLVDKIRWLFALARNKITQTSTTQTLRNDADSGNIATSTDSDNGTTYTRGEWT